MAYIGRFERFSDGKFYLSETIPTDTPYYRVENGKVFYIVWDVVRSEYCERKKIELKMSEEEAVKNDCGCYYKILT